MALSPAVQELIVKARIVSFDGWQDTHPAEAIARLQTADDARLYLTDVDLGILTDMAPAQAALLPIVPRLREQASPIVDEARAGVLAAFPGILEPGGGLYPAERGEACWRDFWHFLRCISYGIAGGRIDYTSAIGLDYMRQLYVSLEVPLDAMVVGLNGLKGASLKRVDPAQQAVLAPYFDHLTEQLEAFRVAG
jgi:hypothetical protein